MVDRYQVVLSVVAVLIMVTVPIACVLLYDLVTGRWDSQLERLKATRSQAMEHRRNVRLLRHQQGAPLEELVSHLRRLRRVAAGDAHRSAAQQNGNRLAYDRVLVAVCEMLDVEHDLDKNSCGLERNIERIRLEAELERAGVMLSDRRYGQAA